MGKRGRRRSKAHTGIVHGIWTPYEATQDEWDALMAELRAEYPVCPDCGSVWEPEMPGAGEVGYGDHETDITVFLFCAAYCAEEDAGRPLPPHPLTASGMVSKTRTFLNPL